MWVGRGCLSYLGSLAHSARRTLALPAQPSGHSTGSGVEANAETPPPLCQELPRFEGASPKGNSMYIGLGTILIILLLFLVLRGVSGRRA